MSTVIVTQDTIFKTKPVQSSALSESEKITIAKGNEYGVKIAEKEGSHYKLTLDHELVGRTVWYAFESHIQVVEAATLVITQDTVFKTKPIQSSDLPDSEKIAVSQRELAIKSFEDVGSHLKVILVNPINDRREWYVFEGHIDMLSIENYAPPQDPPPPPPPQDRGRLIAVPGKGRIYTNDPIVSGANFTWDEATKGGSRIPENANITNNIVSMAGKMQSVREKLGDRSISVTSWYRPPAINRAVGGARNSTHLQGYGVDFNAAGLSPREVQRILDPWWSGGLGYGRTFTHLDGRNYRARWNYGS
ncbi:MULTISPECIES: D-Ala-D-Ala carboxypeptidase family metallohydrolase [Spirulina sp. CCY15215]|uniref:D-Ala-D-Ala carboxypeptidase family metallohydrolase n=1 Tax=Spirulina sp. CCY15215 TaxID=2767591 RepID=UPI00194F991C|nr:D-Ala-D-Ala carboxypeptidase family metallohydrolase [Spirulina major]